LTGFPADARMGWGIAVGGVDGNSGPNGTRNFISVTEFDVTGAVVPEPNTTTLLLCGLAAIGTATLKRHRSQESPAG